MYTLLRKFYSSTDDSWMPEAEWYDSDEDLGIGKDYKIVGDPGYSNGDLIVRNKKTGNLHIWYHDEKPENSISNPIGRSKSTWKKDLQKYEKDTYEKIKKINQVSSDKSKVRDRKDLILPLATISSIGTGALAGNLTKSPKAALVGAGIGGLLGAGIGYKDYNKAKKSYESKYNIKYKG